MKKIFVKKVISFLWKVVLYGLPAAFGGYSLGSCVISDNTAQVENSSTETARVDTIYVNLADYPAE